jgi:hypothetical protein
MDFVPQDVWEELKNDDFGRPTLIGMHLSPIGDQLAGFLVRVEEAAKHLEEDLEYMGLEDDWAARQSIEGAWPPVRSLVIGDQT